MKAISMIAGLVQRHRLRWALFISSIIFFSAPVFAVRIAIFIFWLVFFIDSHTGLEKSFLFPALFIFYCLAYLYAPYWNLADIPLLNIFACVLLFIFGLFWSFYASSQLKIEQKLTDKVSMIILAILLYALNRKPLEADIPWKGDEDYFFVVVADLLEFLISVFSPLISFIRNNMPVSLPIIMIFAFIVWVFFFKSKLKASAKIAAAVFVSLIPFLLATFHVSWASERVIFYNTSFFPISIEFRPVSALLKIAHVLPRYPFVERWFSLFFVYPYTYENVSLYRALPFLSTLFISWVLFYKLNEITRNRWIALSLSFAALTVPSLYFYSSLLYLEMPIVLLMTICMFDLRSLIILRHEELLRKPSWYALLLISFLKETVLVFLVIILAARLLYQLRHREPKSSIGKALSPELRVCFSVIFPLLIYLIFRVGLSHFRQYGFEFRNLFIFPNYLLFLKSLFRQFGILVIMGLFGLLALFRKDRLAGMVCVALLLGMFVFFVSDGIYVGFARWNLFLFPLILLFFFHFIESAAGYLRIAFIPALLVSNMFLMPIHPDGIRLSNWASVHLKDSECVYPYDEAVKWLSRQGKIKNCWIAGIDHEYYALKFYYHRHKIDPETTQFKFAPGDYASEKRQFDKFFSGCARLKSAGKLPAVDAIIYHSINKIDLDEDLLYGDTFKIAGKICNSERCLYIFMKEERPARQ